MSTLKNLDIFVATYTSPTGKSRQKLFSDHTAAKDWLYNNYVTDLGGNNYTVEQLYNLYKKWRKAEPWNAVVKNYVFVVDVEDDLYE